MPYQKLLLKSFGIRFEKMLAGYVLAVEKRDPEGVHDCRVAIKRLRALFRLVESLNPEFDARKRFRRFRKLFKAFADLRDIHIQTGLAEELRGVSGFPKEEYILFLRACERKALDSVNAFSENFSPEILRKSERQIEKALEKLDSETAECRARERYAVLLNDLCERLSSSNPSEDIMHEIRILSKELYYTREVIDEVFPEGQTADEFLPRLKKVHQALGKWHDYDVARLYLKRFTKRGKTIPDHAHVAVKEYIRRRKAVLRDKFRIAREKFTA